MGTWERLFCMHGIQEDLEHHSCDKCQKIGKKLGLSFEEDMFGHTPSYIFDSQKQVDKLMKEKTKKEKKEKKNE